MIEKVAHFQPCSSCRAHGNLVFPGSQSSYAVYSKEGARDVLFQERKISEALSPEECDVIQDQIYDSAMPSHVQDERLNPCTRASTLEMATGLLGAIMNEAELPPLVGPLN